jgi:hypothetical protein
LRKGRAGLEQLGHAEIANLDREEALTWVLLKENIGSLEVSMKNLLMMQTVEAE